MAKQPTKIIEENTSEVEQKFRQDIRQQLDNVNDKIMNIIVEYIADGYQDTLAQLLVYIGSERAERVLDRLPESIRQSVASRYKAESVNKNTDPKIISEAGKVLKRSYIVKFEDIPQLSDMCIQKVLREIDATEAAKALKGASEDIRDKFFRNMSTRAAAAAGR
ncbi:MAG: hypothetical protein IKQ61_12140 [Spirochaetales bacterium]|nr:hypothetical protein [Spirochaetales bacterium]